MTTVMARTRLIIDTDERLRRAVRIAAARAGKKPSDIVNELIAEHLADELAAADEAISEEEDAKPKRKS